MVCPMRCNQKITYEVVNKESNTVLCTGHLEEFPQCYGEECPYYATEWVSLPNGEVKEKGVCSQIVGGEGIFI